MQSLSSLDLRAFALLCGTAAGPVNVFLCHLAQYIKLCQLGHYSMNWFLFLVLVCFFLLVPVVCGTPRRAHHFATFSGTPEMVAS